MKKIIVFLACILTFVLFLSCAEEKGQKEQREFKVEGSDTASPKSTSKSDDLNISFLLDLSDRINPIKYPNETMEFYLRDVAYIQSVAEAFDTHLRTKKVRQMNDKMQVFFDPAPKNKNINIISDNLKHEVLRTNVTIEKIEEIKRIYSIKPLEIYNLAIKDAKYVGSDTWSFFNNKVKDYCIEENHRNILVVLTDGYIYHKDTRRKEGNKTTYITPQTIRGFGLNQGDWEDRLVEEEYGFLPATTGLENLEVMVLGINPDPKNSYEGRCY